MDAGFATIGAALIALLATLMIGVLQLAALDQQNRIDAFDKRFVAFSGVDAALREMCTGNRPNVESLVSFNRSMIQVFFLFPRPLHERLSDVRVQAREMLGRYHELWDDLGNPRDGYTNERLAAYHAAQTKLVSTWECLSDLFRPYMAVTK